MQRYTAKRITDGQRITITVDGGRVSDVSPTGEPPHGEDLWLAPLLIDLQINGRLGIDFLQTDLNSAHVVQAARLLDADAVACALPTVTTQSLPRLSQALTVLAETMESVPEVSTRFPKIHLEGPYLSGEDGPRGAHPRQWIRPPDWDEFQQLQSAARGKIGLITLSPEYESTPAFVKRATRSGVQVSLGHLAATRDQIRAAVDEGASLSTHLGNGAHGQLPRHPNYLWDQLAEDRLSAMVIADGHHVPDEFLKCLVRCKGPERTIAVSDLTGLGGMPPGRYGGTALGDVEILADGKLVVAGQRQYLAGASRPLWMAIPRLLDATDLSLSQAIDCCSKLPARQLGLESQTMEGPRFSGWLFSTKASENRLAGAPQVVFREGIRVFG